MRMYLFCGLPGLFFSGGFEQMTMDLVSLSQIHRLRGFDPAPFHRIRASGVKMTAAGRRQWGGHVAAEYDPLAFFFGVE
jgi:hypothetical protein